MTEPDELSWENEGGPPAGAPDPQSGAPAHPLQPLPPFRFRSYFNEGAHVDL